MNVPRVRTPTAAAGAPPAAVLFDRNPTWWPPGFGFAGIETRWTVHFHGPSANVRLRSVSGLTAGSAGWTECCCSLSVMLNAAMYTFSHPPGFTTTDSIIGAT